MSNQGLEYDGSTALDKKRQLFEVPTDDPVAPAIPIDETDPIDDATTTLFTNLGKAYLKGEKLKQGLSAMEPVQFIPISSDAGRVSRSAQRLSEEQSNKGTIIPFTLYQLAVDILADKQWKVRRMYETVDIPVDSETTSKRIVTDYEFGGGDFENLIKSFLSGDGMAGAIITAFAIGPTQLPIFGLLSAEQAAAKTQSVIQSIWGLAILIELGIKAKRIIDLLRGANSIDPDFEDTITELEENTEKRHKILSDAGIDPDKLSKSQEVDDSKIIINYANAFITSRLDTDPSVFDHWIAYGNVVARQVLIRSSLDSATKYSKDFATMFDRDTASDATFNDVVLNHVRTKPQSRISNVIASHFNDLEKESNDAYDEILNTFMYQVSDADLCCLLSIFGSMDSGGLRLISSMLRIVAIDLKAELITMLEAQTRMLINIATAAAYEIIANLNKISEDLALKIFVSLEDLSEKLSFDLEHCPSFFDVGLALSFGIEAIREKIEKMLLDVLSSIESLGTTSSLSWHVPADRRHLLSIAKILDVLSDKLDAANACARREDTPTSVEQILTDSKDQAAHELIHTLLDKSPPSIQISDTDIRKYFPDLRPTKSKRFGFVFGPKTIFPDSVGKRGEALNNCGMTITEDHKNRIKKALSESMAKAFGAEDG